MFLSSNEQPSVQLAGLIEAKCEQVAAKTVAFPGCKPHPETIGDLTRDSPRGDIVPRPSASGILPQGATEKVGRGSKNLPERLARIGTLAAHLDVSHLDPGACADELHGLHE